LAHILAWLNEKFIRFFLTRWKNFILAFFWSFHLGNVQKI